MATTVIGYRNAEEKKTLLDRLRPWTRRRASEAETEYNIEAIRDTVETVIGFWKLPLTYDRSSSNTTSGSVAFVSSLYGLNEADFNYDLNVEPNPRYFGANMSVNLNVSEYSYWMAQKEMFAAEVRASESSEQTTSLEQSSHR